jgi:hypothetical protein
MKSHRNDRNRDAVSGWEDDGGAGGTDAARTTDNAPAAHDSEQRRLDTSHHSDIRGEHRYDDVHQTGPEREARQDRDILKQRLAGRFARRHS